MKRERREGLRRSKSYVLCFMRRCLKIASPILRSSPLQFLEECSYLRSNALRESHFFWCIVRFRWCISWLRRVLRYEGEWYGCCVLKGVCYLSSYEGTWIFLWEESHFCRNVRYESLRHGPIWLSDRTGDFIEKRESEDGTIRPSMILERCETRIYGVIFDNAILFLKVWEIKILRENLGTLGVLS